MSATATQPTNTSTDAGFPPAPPATHQLAEPNWDMTATYSPEDNKLRLYPTSRLPEELYRRVHGAGFIWAPKQELFVAPMWTPERAELLEELCGEIGDEDRSLVDRAEERAERFDGYEDNRRRDAVRARDAVASITEGIPLGQPILVGHHSERRARRDAERIEAGMRKAVKMWDTAEYWQRRARGAIAAAKYKELPAVRARRIKAIEADRRKQERARNEAEGLVKAYQSPDALKVELTNGRGLVRELLGSYGGGLCVDDRDALRGGTLTFEDALTKAIAGQQRRLAWLDRWIAHYDNRLAYERAMLGEQGGLAADRFDIQPGGFVFTRGEWATVVRVTKRDGKVISVSTNSRYAAVRSIEDVQDYRAPTAESAAKATEKKPPLCNYPGPGFHHMSKAEWDATHKDYKGSRELGQGAKRAGGYRPDIKASVAEGEVHGRHRVRSVVHRGALVAVYITDSKVSNPPPAQGVECHVAAPIEPPVVQVRTAAVAHATASQKPVSDFDLMREQLRTGVQVVAAPQLFPTPVALAERMVAAAGIIDGDRVLEPSAGTGRLVQALRDTGKVLHIVAVEINHDLARRLTQTFPSAASAVPQEVEVIEADFLELRSLGHFTRILMNPPFVDGADIKHIEHAVRILEAGAGGRLVAICANGPRQQERLGALVAKHGGTWEDLPAGTFTNSGTEVRTALIVIDL